MDLFLVPNNPEHSVIVSPNGVAHYRIRTATLDDGTRLTAIQRPADSIEDSIVAEIEWRRWTMPTIVRSPLIKGIGRCMGKSGVGIRATKLLYKKHRFSPSRYFVGEDEVEYKWKRIKGVGSVLMESSTQEEVARYTTTIASEGLFAGERKSVLRLQPCSVDVDLVVLTFVILEKKRRDGMEEGKPPPHDEDPQGDGGGSADGGLGEA